MDDAIKISWLNTVEKGQDSDFRGMLESNGVLSAYENAMARVDADIVALPYTIQIWIDIMPTSEPGSRVVCGVTTTYLGDGSVPSCCFAVATYSITQQQVAAGQQLQLWSEDYARKQLDHWRSGELKKVAAPLNAAVDAATTHRNDVVSATAEQLATTIAEAIWH